MLVSVRATFASFDVLSVCYGSRRKRKFCQSCSACVPFIIWQQDYTPTTFSRETENEWSERKHVNSQVEMESCTTSKRGTSFGKKINAYFRACIFKRLLIKRMLILLHCEGWSASVSPALKRGRGSNHVSVFHAFNSITLFLSLNKLCLFLYNSAKRIGRSCWSIYYC